MAQDRDVQIIVFGPALVYVNDEKLGYTRNGVDFTDEGFFIDVPGDEYGGDEGPPIDVQYLGGIARFRIELTKYDLATASKLIGRIPDASVGTIKAGFNSPGTLLFQDSNTYVVHIESVETGFKMRFPRAIIRNPIELNRGTKFTTLVMEIEGHADDNGVIYDAG